MGLFTKKEQTTYTQDQYTALEERLSKLQEKNDTIDAGYKQDLTNLKADFVKRENFLQDRIVELEATPQIVETALTSAIGLHHFKRGGSVFAHGQDMELWECVDGCNTNPVANCRILLPTGMVI